MLRARAELDGYPLIIFGLSTGNLTKLQEKKPMLIDLRTEFAIDAAVLVMWGETEEAIQKDIEENGLPVKLSGEPIQLAGPTGEYPQGKLRNDDRGELRVAVNVEPEKQRIVVNFGTSVNWIGLGAEDAEALGSALVNYAAQLRLGAS